MKAVLVSQQPETLGREYILGETTVSVGRVPENDIALASLAVSRHHARISWSEDGYVLEDLDSRNGTWLNNRRISSAVPLQDGDLVAFGDQPFSFRLIDASTLTVPATPVVVSPIVTVLFTDVESSTATRRQLGDTRAQDIVRAHNAIVREALRQSGGREVKQTGDGIMAAFSAVSNALNCAVEIQRAIAAHAAAHPELPFRAYIGLNAGEPIAEEEDLFGTCVDLAARICAQATPGQILVSDVVRQLAEGKGFSFSDQGEADLRGFEDPCRVYEVQWRA